MERADFRGGNPNGFAIAPDGQRPCLTAVILHHFGHGIGQGLHRLLREWGLAWFFHGANSFRSRS
jgi:hypothetical protein